MRKVFCAIVALFPWLATAQTHVLFTLSEFNATPTTNRTVTVQPMTPFRGNLTSYSSSTNGYFYASNMAAGDYDCVILKRGTANEIAFQVTVTSASLGVINAASNTSVRGVQSYPVSGKSAWTILASEARYGAASISDGTLTTNKIDTTFRTWIEGQDSEKLDRSNGSSTNQTMRGDAVVAATTWTVTGDGNAVFTTLDGGNLITLGGEGINSWDDVTNHFAFPSNANLASSTNLPYAGLSAAAQSQIETNAAYQAYLATNNFTAGTFGALTNNETRSAAFLNSLFTIGDGTGSNVLNLSGDYGWIGSGQAGFVLDDAHSLISIPGGIDFSGTNIQSGTLDTNAIDSTFYNFILDQSSAGISSATATNIVDAKLAALAPLTNGETRTVTLAGSTLTVGGSTGSNMVDIASGLGFVGADGAGFVFDKTNSTITVPNGVSLLGDGTSLTGVSTDTEFAAALTNNETRVVRFTSLVAMPTNYTDRVEATNSSTLTLYGGGLEAALESGAFKVRSPYYFDGLATGLTDIPGSGITSGSISNAAIADATITSNKLAFAIGATDDTAFSYGISMWGDSLTLGGAPYVATALPTNHILNHGIGGQNSTLIKNRFLTETNLWGWPTIIWSGANDYGTLYASVTNNVATMVSQLTTTNYLVAGLMINTNYLLASAEHTNFTRVNTELATQYGARFTNIHAFLVSQGTPGDYYYTNDLVPPALAVDAIHLNATGYGLVATQFSRTINSLWGRPVANGDLAISVNQVTETLAHPPQVGPLRFSYGNNTNGAETLTVFGVHPTNAASSVSEFNSDGTAWIKSGFYIGGSKTGSTGYLLGGATSSTDWTLGYGGDLIFKAIQPGYLTRAILDDSGNFSAAGIINGTNGFKIGTDAVDSWNDVTNFFAFPTQFNFWETNIVAASSVSNAYNMKSTGSLVLQPNGNTNRLTFAGTLPASVNGGTGPFVAGWDGANALATIGIGDGSGSYGLGLFKRTGSASTELHRFFDDGGAWHSGLLALGGSKTGSSGYIQAGASGSADWNFGYGGDLIFKAVQPGYLARAILDDTGTFAATNGFKSAASSQIFYTPSNAPTAGQVLTAVGTDGHTAWSNAPSSGSATNLTPWSSDINADGNNLYEAATIYGSSNSAALTLTGSADAQDNAISIYRTNSGNGIAYFSQIGHEFTGPVSFVDGIGNISAGTVAATGNLTATGTSNYVAALHTDTFSMNELDVENLYATNVTFVGSASYSTNAATIAPNFNLSYQLWATNAAFTFGLPLNLDATKFQSCVVFVTNSTAAAVLVSPPAAVKIQGVWYCTNVSSFTFSQYGNQWTNAVALPLW